MTNSLALLAKGSLPDGIDRPNFMAISTKVMAGNLSPSELFDLNTTFWRDPAGSVHPLPNSRGRDANGFSHAINVSEEVDSFRDIHCTSIKQFFIQEQGIDQSIAFYDYQGMPDTHKRWLANQIVQAIEESRLSKRAVGIACGIPEKSAGQTVQGWIKTGTIGKDRLAILAKVTNKSIGYFIRGADAPTKVEGVGQEVVSTLDRLLAMNALSESALMGLLAHLKSYDPSALSNDKATNQPLTSETIDAPRIDQVPADVVAEDESFLKQQMIKKSSKKSA